MSTDEATFGNLRRFNGTIAVLHFVQGALMVHLSTERTWTITETRLEFQEATQTLASVTDPWAEIQLSLLVASFLFISALAHFLISTVLYDSYVEYRKKGMNSYRWYEYSVSASVMIVVIAMLAGIWDLGTLLSLFALVAVMNLMGLQVAVHNQTTEGTDWTAYWIGVLAGIVPWIVIAITIIFTAGAGQGDIPDFVIAIYVTIAVLFNRFAINMVLQYHGVWKWADYLYGERVSIVRSLVAKSLLAWQVYFGALNAPVSFSRSQSDSQEFLFIRLTYFAIAASSILMKSARVFIIGGTPTLAESNR